MLITEKVFYATQASYACSVLINIDRLNNIFHTPHRIIVVVKPSLPSEYLSKFTEQNATVIPYEPPPLPNDFAYYTDVLLKLVGFRLHQYIPSLKRILILDSDQLILQSLDHLFSLPDTDVAAPRMYWGDDTATLTSALILVKLSDRLWNQVDVAMRELSGYSFDMEVVNQLFKKNALVLPGTYCTLNSQWETNELPSWWQGVEPPRDPSFKVSIPPPQKPTRRQKSTRSDVPSNKTNSGNVAELKPRSQDRFVDDDSYGEDTIDGEDTTDGEDTAASALDSDPNSSQSLRVASPERTEEQEKVAEEAAQKAYKAVVWDEEHRERRPRLEKTLEKMYYDEVKVLHYTAFGKPWTSPPWRVKQEKPMAHWLLAEQFGVWRKRASEICPGFEGLDK